MRDKFIAAVLFVVGVVNLLPMLAFFDASQTVRLYGFPIAGESLTILMRHRRVLLGLIGTALIAAAIKPEYRILAIALALVSKFAFIFLTFTAPDRTAEVRQVALIDVAATILLLAVSAIHFWRAPAKL